MFGGSKQAAEEEEEEEDSTSQNPLASLFGGAKKAKVGLSILLAPLSCSGLRWFS